MSKTKSQLQATQRRLEAELAAVKKQFQAVEKVETGEHPSPAQKKLIDSQDFSYGVHFLRRKALKKGKSPGSVCVSQRRFSSLKEAKQHGVRFTKKHKHKSFSVTIVSKRANAWINWKTGKTNPVL